MYFSQKPELNELYTELQSVANVPMIEEQKSKNFTPLNAIEELLNKEKLHKKTKKRARKLSNKISNVKKEKEELESTLHKVEEEYHFTKKSVQEKTLENEELLTQLMSVQEELEKYYLENDLTKKEKEEALQKMKQLSLEIEKQKEEVNKIKASDKEVQKTINSLKTEHKKIKQLLDTKEKNVQEKTLENEELLTQLMSVQEELEKYYLEAQSLKSKIEERKRYYGAAERIKEQLSYRLGKKMIEESKSFFGILGLPFSLMGVHSEYKKDMQAKKGKKLPPIESYADAYDAQRVKRHLSYMLGQTMIETMKGNPFGVFVLPFKLRSTYKLYKKQREA
jgi:chromosome segregation ATPase